jgi:hypothetical protein
MLNDNTARGGQADPVDSAVAVDNFGGDAAPDTKRADLPAKEGTDIAGVAPLRKADDSDPRAFVGGDVSNGGAGTTGGLGDASRPGDVPDNSADHPAERPALAVEVGTLIAWAALACLLTLVNRYAGAVVPLPPYGTLAGHLLAVLYLAPLLLSLLQTARCAVVLPVSAPFLFVSGAILSLPSLLVVFLTLTRADLPLVTYFYNALPPPLQTVLNNFLGPIGLSLLGAAIGRVIRHPNTLLAAAGFSIFFDIVVVTMGTVAQLMRSGSNLIASVSVGAGAPAAALPGAPQVKLPEPISGVTIGPADVLFLALFLAAVHFLRRTWKEAPEGYVERSWRETLYWMYGLLLLALVLVEIFSLPIPALVPMGVAVLIANARLAAFTPTERRDLVIGGVFALFCAVGIIWWARRTVPPRPPELGIQLARDNRTGAVFIARVLPNSPAAKGGILERDLLLSVNGQSLQELVTTPQEFDRAMANSPRDGLIVRVLRRGERNPRELRLPPALFGERSQ